MEERLQKLISSLGIMSRRKAEEVIKEGRITVNGRVAQVGMKADMARDAIKIDGKLVTLRQDHRLLYLKLYKPVGVITSMEDPEGRPTVGDMVQGLKVRIYPVGRLDYHSEGLLLLTNDGDFAYKVLHPSKKIPKTYHVKVKGEIDDKVLEKLRRGVMLDDGRTAPAEVDRLVDMKAKSNTWIAITLMEGRKRQIRRMMERVKHPVAKLKRVSIGTIQLGALKPGQWDYLTESEMNGFLREYGQEKDPVPRKSPGKGGVTAAPPSGENARK